MRSRSAALLALSVALSFSGCKPDAAVKQAEPLGRNAEIPKAVQPNLTAVTADPNTTGTVTGTVHLSGTAPAPVKIDMSMDPVCNMTAADNFSEQYVAKGGKLANVFVYLKSGPAAAMSASPGLAGPDGIKTSIDQKGCRYAPHVIAIVQGGSVEFRNSDNTMHNVHTMPTTVGNEAIDVSQPPRGEAQVRQFPVAEVMMPIRCNNHPWMNAFLNVSATPFFAISGKDGSFTISGLPPGDYVLGFAHEKLGEQTVKVTVAAKGTAKADATFAMQ